MLHRALATLLCVLGALALGLGVASATVWRPADTLVATGQAPDGSTLLLTDPGVLDLGAQDVDVRAEGPGTVVVALARTSEVEAWVGEDAHGRVTGLLDRETLGVTAVAAGTSDDAEDAGDGGTSGEAAPDDEPAPDDEAAPEDEAATEDEAPAEEPATDDGASTDEAASEDEATPAPDPAGSDLWIRESSGEGEAELDWTAEPGRWSVLVASTGADAGPPSLTLTWPQEVRTPWLWPGVLVGSALLLAGAIWWLVILLGPRRRRGAPAPDPVGPSLGPAAVPETPGTTGDATPTAPLTRRQLRELEERRAAEVRRAGEEQKRREREAERVRARFPLQLTLRGGPTATPDASPPAGERTPTTPAAPAPPATRTTGEPSGDASAPPADGTTPREARSGWRSRAGRLVPRSDARQAPDAAPQAPAPEPVDPPAPPTPPAAPPSAWRRTWGFTAPGTPEGAQDATPSTPDAAPGAPEATPPPDGTTPTRREGEQR